MDMGNGCRKKENDFLGFTRKILVESTEMCYDTSVGKIHAQIWFIGRTLASQAGKAGSIPVICLNYLRNEKPCRCINSICRAFSKLLANFANYCYNNADLERFRI